MEIKLDMTEGVNEVIPKVYEDTIQPSAKIIGNIGETLCKTINTALMPLKIMNYAGEIIEKNIKISLEKKLKNIPIENIQTPNPRISGLVFENLKYSVQEEEIREMFISLLANAMNKEKNSKVHPVFVEIINQLSSLDCIVFKELTREFDQHIYGVILDNLHLILSSFKEEYYLDSDEILTKENIHFSIENLIKQGLFEIISVDPYKDKNYQKLPLLRGKNQYGIVLKDDKIIKLTTLGKVFKEICGE